MRAIPPPAGRCRWCGEAADHGSCCRVCLALHAGACHERLLLAWRQVQNGAWHQSGGWNLLLRRLAFLAGQFIRSPLFCTRLLRQGRQWPAPSPLPAVHCDDASSCRLSTYIKL
ncbi:MAG TPA: hypothetical protein GXX29_00460, partial [Firmicutes bacterium]|nr:hypothetical protein [Bacillota bacterium]